MLNQQHPNIGLYLHYYHCTVKLSQCIKNKSIGILLRIQEEEEKQHITSSGCPAISVSQSSLEIKVNTAAWGVALKNSFLNLGLKYGSNGSNLV